MNGRYRSRLIWLLVTWAVLAVTVVASGVLIRLPRFAAQGMIAAQMIIFFAVLVVAPGFRDYLFSRDLKSLTAFHAWRVIPGALFLYYFYQLHQLPWNFAVPGGYGDIAVAFTALPASELAASAWPGRWKALLAWQALAFLDLLGVVRAGLMNGLHNPESMRALTHFPLAFLPAMLVALTFMFHIVAVVQIVHRMRERSPAAPSERGQRD